MADLRGGAPSARPPAMVQNFLNFMQFFGEFGKIIRRHPLPGGLAPPPTENPGSTPVPSKVTVNNTYSITVHFDKLIQD